MPTSVGDLNFVTVHATYEDYSGAAQAGSVVFKPSTVLLDAAGDLILVPKTFTATLDGAGHFSIDLPATDDPDVNPVGWTYQVTETLSGGGGRSFSLQVPIAAAPSVSLAALAPADSSSGLVSYALRSDVVVSTARAAAFALVFGG